MESKEELKEKIAEWEKKLKTRYYKNLFFDVDKEAQHEHDFECLDNLNVLRRDLIKILEVELDALSNPAS